jgi:hypothetical protein
MVNELIPATSGNERSGHHCASESERHRSQMMTARRLGALIALLAISCAAGSEPGVEDDVLLALPWKQFDQTLGSGWRVYATRDQHLRAARLIERYLAERNDLTPVQRAVSHFHAGAELARVNIHKEALSHFDQAIVAAGSKGVPEDWNELVAANKAFVLGDRAALLAAKQRVDAMRSPAFRETFATLLEYLGQPWGAWDDEPKH